MISNDVFYLTQHIFSITILIIIITGMYEHWFFFATLPLKSNMYFTAVAYLHWDPHNCIWCMKRAQTEGTEVRFSTIQPLDTGQILVGKSCSCPFHLDGPSLPYSANCHWSGAWFAWWPPSLHSSCLYWRTSCSWVVSFCLHWCWALQPSPPTPSSGIRFLATLRLLPPSSGQTAVFLIIVSTCLEALTLFYFFSKTLTNSQLGGSSVCDKLSRSWESGEQGTERWMQDNESLSVYSLALIRCWGLCDSLRLGRSLSEVLSHLWSWLASVTSSVCLE